MPHPSPGEAASILGSEQADHHVVLRPDASAQASKSVAVSSSTAMPRAHSPFLSSFGANSKACHDASPHPGLERCVEVDEDPAEVKTEDDGETKKEVKKKTKTVVEKYWDWELTNETQPIWLRTPKEVSTEEYNEFYKKTFNEYLDPLASSHFTTEGEVEFRSILYVRATKKEDITDRKTKNIRLYVKRVFISDDFDGELFPSYLSFVKGIVDCCWSLSDARRVCNLYFCRKRIVFLVALDLIIPSVTALLSALGAAMQGASIAGDERDSSGTAMAAAAGLSDDFAKFGKPFSGMNALAT
ncbi:Heat shock protein 83 [Hordeum vulgare]|nr:Heat shock protein 83 [Hordeum vulgare]